MRRRPLHEGWTVRAAAGPVPDEIAGRRVAAQVPGCVHVDLLDAGLIPDPLVDVNEALTAWIGLVDWTYAATFEVTDDERAASEHHELVFDGLDTVAAVRLNGRLLGEVANQHRTWRFDVADALVRGANTLEVAFSSPVRYANAQSLALGTRPRPYPLPYEAIRKSACSFGWDWGPITATSGIWRPVRLESWSSARLDEVRVRAEATEHGGRLAVAVTTASAASSPFTVEVDVAGRTATAEVAAGRAELTLELDDVERWWPVGYGEQPLYDVAVRLRAGEAEPDAAHRRVGFRTVRWDETPDEHGTPFTLVVNDRPVFVKGVNWIPDDALAVRVDRARHATRLRQARDAHVNLVRVWGGGLYESDDFYDLCDELGLLTWQDFLFACAAYPEEEPLRSEIEPEARQNVLRLAHHASLVLLCGNNENQVAYEEWGWERLLDGATWGAHYYDTVLPGVIDDVAPQVPYIVSSPFSPDGRPARDPDHGSVHLWAMWNHLDWPHYRDDTPRFVAEFGWQGPPTWTTLTRALSDDPLTPESPGMVAHQKAPGGQGKLVGGLLPHYRVPQTMEDWHWAMQLNQADAVACALDHFRSHWPRTAGAVVWQLNDCWPVTSWAAIDGDGRPKPLYHALAASFAPRVVRVHPEGDSLVVAAVNDTDEAWVGDLVVRLFGFDGTPRREYRERVEVAARGVARLPLPDDLAATDSPADTVLLAELGTPEAPHERGWWFFAEPRDADLPAPDAQVQVSPVEGGQAVRVRAGVLLREVTLLADKLHPDAVADTGLVTLLPGEQHTFVVRGCPGLTDAAASDPRVLRSANQLVG